MKKNIVILGAGFGGLRVALDVEANISGSTPEAKEWRVILVDRNPYHMYYPRLYELIMPGDKKKCLHY